MTATPLLLSAGEASGDMYAARLAEALRERADVALFGMGGPRMRAAGVETVVDYSAVAVLGITEVLKQLPSLRRAMGRLVGEAEKRKPPLAILTDFPGFHLRLARKLRPLATQNVYYICPQFWAWRPWRANLVRRRFALALCIFPFEEKFYRDAGVNVEFIGHPLVGEVHATMSREEFCAKHGLRTEEPILTVLPGSRRGEIGYHGPILGAAVLELRREDPELQVLVAVAPGVRREELETHFPAGSAQLVEDATYDAVNTADVAIVSSGTATVEAALLQKPMVVVYRLSPTTARLAKPLVRTKFFSMVNLIAGRAVVPELIQDEFTANRVAGEARCLLGASNEGAAKVAEMRRGLAEVARLLGPPGAVERAADAIVRQLRMAQSNVK